VVDSEHDYESDFERLEAMGKDWGDSYNEEHRPSRAGQSEERDRKYDAMQNMPSRPQSLHEYLIEQVNLLDLPGRIADLARHLITNLDNNGWLTSGLEAAFADYQPPVTPDEAQSALAVVQKLEPLGVGARDLRECLLLQLTDETPHRDVVRALIEHHWDDMRHNRLPVIQKRTGFELSAIKEAIEALAHLNFRPGAAFASEHAPYVVPDIAVEETESGDYQVRLLDDYLPSVYINRRYFEMLKDKRQSPQTREFIKRKIQSAQWLLESIEQRRNTLEKVTKAIVQHQRGFLEKGPDHIAPLKMQQIATEVGVHVTTVSRAVDDKWAQTPRGVFRLRDFFRHGTTTAEGEEIAWDIIKQKLFDIVGKEDKTRPYSDEELVEKMQESGYPLARRTVTKYRKLLKIPSSRQRRDWTLPDGHAAEAAPPIAEPAAPITVTPRVTAIRDGDANAAAVIPANDGIAAVAVTPETNHVSEATP
jgi:RNA polymerase sigma-54 factor